MDKSQNILDSNLKYLLTFSRVSLLLALIIRFVTKNIEYSPLKVKSTIHIKDLICLAKYKVIKGKYSVLKQEHLLYRNLDLAKAVYPNEFN